jgi:hypothetical protein
MGKYTVKQEGMPEKKPAAKEKTGPKAGGTLRTRTRPTL